MVQNLKSLGKYSHFYETGPLRDISSVFNSKCPNMLFKVDPYFNFKR